LHLHCTQKEPAKNGPAFLFREAVKRQSKLDREAFRVTREISEFDLVASPALPWAWANGCSADVVWVNFMSELLEDEDRAMLEETCQLKWDANSCIGSRATSLRSGSFDSRLELGNTMLPICLGRPDWHVEIQAIGKAWPEDDIHVYACGGDAMVASLQNVCKVCNTHSQKASRSQRFIFRRESFGA